MVRTQPDWAGRWSDDQVARRWCGLDLQVAAAGTAIGGPPGVVALAGALVLACAVPAALPYREARRRRAMP